MEKGPSYVNNERKLYAQRAISLPINEDFKSPEEKCSADPEEQPPKSEELPLHIKDVVTVLNGLWAASNGDWENWMRIATEHNNNTPFETVILESLREYSNHTIISNYLTCI